MASADRTAPPLVPVVVAVQPMVGLPVVQRVRHRVLRFGQAGRVGGRFQDRDVGAGLHDQLAERHVRVAAGELAVGREGVDAHRVAVRVVGGVVVDQVAHIAGEEVLAAPRLGDVLGELAAFGAGWTSESTHRTAMRSAAGTRSCEWVSVIWISSVCRVTSTVRTDAGGGRLCHTARPRCASTISRAVRRDSALGSLLTSPNCQCG